ncbi:MAG: hypothetical protein KA715_07710 [Xanthomonadaceae bacterium]|nr:hypothetical protein [Xanthomonadaceae bacterium]
MTTRLAVKPADRQGLTACVGARIPVMFDQQRAETTFMDTSSRLTVEFGGSGEQISLEFDSNLSPNELKTLWKSSLPKSTTQVLEKQNENLTQIKLTHSYLLDENECIEMKNYWNEFSQKVGQT